RLPGLYGPGLKKNVIHDFLHAHETEKIDARGVFQFYGVHRLWKDIMTAREAAIPVVHLVTEPVSVADVARDAFDMSFTNALDRPPARYDLHTRFAERFGGTGPYIQDRARVLGGIRDFVMSSR